nr:PREDICTED: kinesin-like protein KIF21B [Latimeria chalumnae]|eukprot:XP_014348636.1 PREDICTED: kinesin-like protein KIF21B [Latimeria chalumnae]
MYKRSEKVRPAVASVEFSIVSGAADILHYFTVILFWFHSLSAAAEEEQRAVQVCVRIQPLVSREKIGSEEDSVPVYWKADRHTVFQTDGSKSFNFDRVFHSEETTRKVYQELTLPIVHSTIHGYNGTIFAYGQTSSGKTYTMMGTEVSLGVIPQAIHDVFKIIFQASRKTKKKEGGAKYAQRASSNVFSMFEQTQIQEFKEAFTLIDQNRDGFIDKEDLKDTYASLGKLNVKDDELEAMLKEASGPINFTMFLNLFGEKLHVFLMLRCSFACLQRPPVCLRRPGAVCGQRLRSPGLAGLVERSSGSPAVFVACLPASGGWVWHMVASGLLLKFSEDFLLPAGLEFFFCVWEIWLRWHRGLFLFGCRSSLSVGFSDGPPV